MRGRRRSDKEPRLEAAPHRTARAVDIGTFHEAAEAAEFRLDAAQAAASTRLAAVAQALSAGSPAPSLYLWGPVGRGKTWLVDVFVGALPSGSARRFHFHSFFRQFHDGLGRHGPGHASVGRSLDDAIGDARVVCFDELYVHEPGDAQLFTMILRELRERRELPMVVTSNYLPDGLMPDAEFVTTGLGAWDPVKVRHASFQPGIDVIKRTFEVIGIDGGLDYRSIGSPSSVEGFASGAYIIGRRRPSAGPGSGSGVPVALEGGRCVRAERVDRRDVTFAFEELCERPVSASDVTRLTERFNRWTLLDVPPLAGCSPEAAQRFVNLLDVLCDANVRLTVLSQVAPPELVGGAVPPDIARAQSRLAMLAVQRHDPT